jgi:hypothetical protein
MYYRNEKFNRFVDRARRAGYVVIDYGTPQYLGPAIRILKSGDKRLSKEYAEACNVMEMELSSCEDENYSYFLPFE